MKTKILITGSSGFIGFHLTKKLLEKGNKVHGYDSMNNYYDVKLKKARLKILKTYKGFSFTKSKLENMKTLEKIFNKFRPNVVIHLAAQAGVRYSLENPDVYLDTNILGTFNVIKNSKKIKVKHLIIGSSSSVYGANKKIPFQEIDKTDHQVSFYAATKKSTESLAHSYSSLWGLPVTMLRFFTVYGPWGRPDMALFKFTKNILAGDKIDIFNNGNHKRDFTYIDDIVDGIIECMEFKNSTSSINTILSDPVNTEAPWKIFNIGSNSPIDLMDFIKVLEVLTTSARRCSRYLC